MRKQQQQIAEKRAVIAFNSILQLSKLQCDPPLSVVQRLRLKVSHFSRQLFSYFFFYFFLIFYLFFKLLPRSSHAVSALSQVLFAR